MLGGDIDSDPESLQVFLMECVKRFKFVFYVPGNHEYYSKTIAYVNGMLNEMNRDMSDCFRAWTPEYKNSVVIGHIRFIGATLWTDFDEYDPIIVYSIRNGMNDYRCIYKDGNSRDDLIELRDRSVAGFIDHSEYYDALQESKQQILLPENVYEYHLRDKKIIEEGIAFSDLTNVVMTHHIPTELHFEFGHECNMLRDMTYAYNCTDMDDIIRKADYWFCGHGHNVGTEYFGTCTIITNAVGYGSHEGLPTKHEVIEIENTIVTE
jgi:hypothetical protein